MDQTKLINWILKIGTAGTFLGHGVFAFGVKASWISYLTTVGFSVSTAMKIMPVIGCIDFIVAAVVLFRPYKIVLLYAIFWTLATATIRPLAGEPIWAFVERAANWAVPLTLLLLNGFPVSWKCLFRV